MFGFKRSCSVPLLILNLVIAISGCERATSDRFPYTSKYSDFEVKAQASKSLHKNQRVFSIIWKDVSGVFRIEPAKESMETEAAIAAKLVSYTSGYRKMNAPYGGHITREIGCATREHVFQRDFSFKGAQTKIQFGLANERKIVGACTWGQVHYRTGLWMFYDRSAGNLVEAEIAHPIKSAEELDRADQEIISLIQSLSSSSKDQ